MAAQERPRPRHRGRAVALVVLLVLVIAAATVAGLHYVGVLGDPEWLRFLPMREVPAETQAATTDAATTDAATTVAATTQAATNGQAYVQLPSLAGKSEQEARDAISAAGLTVGSVTTQESSSVVAGRVISQSASGSVPKGTSVDLVISKGSPTPTNNPGAAKTYVIVDQAMTWSEAKAYCEQNGGRLATIHSQEEWDQVLALMQADGRKVYWLGAQRTSDGFQWLDGTSVTFSAYASGEPNNDTGDENYLAVFDSNGSWGWYDVPNDISSYYKSEKMAFVMEKDS